MKAEKDGTNPHFRSDYMKLDGILNKVKPILTEVDIGVLQSIETNDRDVTCTTMLLHDSGQVMAGCATVHADKDTPQGFGSAITYARRYGIATLLGIADCEDDDGNGADATSKKKVVSKPAPKPAPKIAPQPEKVVITKLTKIQIEQILNAFDTNIGVNVNDLEGKFGPVDDWDTNTRKELLDCYDKLVNKKISKENFLAN